MREVLERDVPQVVWNPANTGCSLQFGPIVFAKLENDIRWLSPMLLPVAILDWLNERDEVVIVRAVSLICIIPVS